MVVDGFGDTTAYEVKLYAVDKGENASAPVSVTVHPLRAPRKVGAGQSCFGIPDFGGLQR
jgi:hypothetical protein